MLPGLESFPLPAGWVVHDAGDCENYLYFITSGIVSRYSVTKSGASAEFAVTGSEGVIGVSLFLGGASVPSRAVVLGAGHSYRLRAELLKHEFEHDGPLPRLLLRYTQALIAQIGLVSVCKRHHSLEQRFCRWVLSCLDRLPTNELAITHGLIAAMLGVRREGVTEMVGRLQAARIIRCGRSRIVVTDRSAPGSARMRVLRGRQARIRPLAGRVRLAARRRRMLSACAIARWTLGNCGRMNAQ